MRDRAAPDAETEQLPRRYDAVLAFREQRDSARLRLVMNVSVKGNLGEHEPSLPGQFARECDGLQRMSDIPHRELGRSGLSVSVLGLGSWQTFDKIGATTPEQVAENVGAAA